MKSATIIFTFTCIVSALAFSNYGDCDKPYNKQYALCGGINRDRQGATHGTVGLRKQIHDSDRFRVDGNVFTSKKLQPSGPYTVGGGVGLTHKPTGSEVNVNAQHTRGRGSDVGVGAAYNFFQHKDTSVKATGEIQQHFGPGGSSKPDYVVGVQLESKI